MDGHSDKNSHFPPISFELKFNICHLSVFCYVFTGVWFVKLFVCDFPASTIVLNSTWLSLIYIFSFFFLFADFRVFVYFLLNSFSMRLARTHIILIAHCICATVAIHSHRRIIRGYSHCHPTKRLWDENEINKESTKLADSMLFLSIKKDVQQKYTDS